jgi:hypothetical protein
MWYCCSSHQPFNSGAKRLTLHWLALSYLWRINFGLYFCCVYLCKSGVLCVRWVNKFASVCLFQLSCYDWVSFVACQVVVIRLVFLSIGNTTTGLSLSSEIHQGLVFHCICIPEKVDISRKCYSTKTKGLEISGSKPAKEFWSENALM